MASRARAGGLRHGHGVVRRRAQDRLGRSCGATLATLGGHQVADEDERLARLDHVPGAPVPVGQVRRDDQLPSAADLHPLDALVPARDDLPGAQPEAQRLATVPARVELLAGRVGDPDVVHLNGVACARDLALTFPDVGDLQLHGRLAPGEVDLRPACVHLALPFVWLRDSPTLWLGSCAEATWCGLW